MTLTRSHPRVTASHESRPASVKKKNTPRAPEECGGPPPSPRSRSPNPGQETTEKDLWEQYESAVLIPEEPLVEPEPASSSEVDPPDAKRRALALLLTAPNSLNPRDAAKVVEVMCQRSASSSFSHFQITQQQRRAASDSVAALTSDAAKKRILADLHEIEETHTPPVHAPSERSKCLAKKKLQSQFLVSIR